MFLATMRGFTRVVRELLAAGASVKDCEEDETASPLLIAFIQVS